MNNLKKAVVKLKIVMLMDELFQKYNLPEGEMLDDLRQFQMDALKEVQDDLAKLPIPTEVA